MKTAVGTGMTKPMTVTATPIMIMNAVTGRTTASRPASTVKVYATPVINFRAAAQAAAFILRYEQQTHLLSFFAGGFCVQQLRQTTCAEVSRLRQFPGAESGAAKQPAGY
jgi:hypothetical protein